MDSQSINSKVLEKKYDMPIRTELNSPPRFFEFELNLKFYEEELCFIIFFYTKIAVY